MHVQFGQNFSLEKIRHDKTTHDEAELVRFSYRHVKNLRFY
jgi:hypothetical protein